MRERKEALVRRARLEGRVLDVGSGTGTQLKYVCGAAAPRVRELVCVEPNPFFHARLRAAIRVAEDDAARAGVRVSISLFEGTLAQYAAATGGAAAGSFDAITCLLVLCSVPDVDAALSECAALLRPGKGQLLFLEHVAAEPGWRRAAQSAMQPLWNLCGDGCQLCRDTGAALDRIGERTGRWVRRSSCESARPRAGWARIMPMICGVCEPR